MDPRAIRCGIDDRPRNVLGVDLPPQAPQVLLAEVVAGAPAPPRKRRMDMAPEPIPNPGPPPPRLLIERGPAVLSGGGPLPPELVSAFRTIDPQYEVCNPLAPQDFPGGPLTLEVELASSGAPLRVLPVGDGEVTPFARCLQERACQYQTRASLGQITRVRVPLQVHRDQPLPQPPSPQPPIQVRVDAASESPSANLAELQLQLRTILAEAAQDCGPVSGRAQVRFLLDMTRHEGFRRRPSPRQRVVMPRAFTQVDQVRTQTLSGHVPTDVLACIVGSISGRGFSEAGFSGKRTERVLLTWNP
jgi:hypothetical protein